MSVSVATVPAARPRRARGPYRAPRRGIRHSRKVTTDAVILRDAVAGYSRRLHAVAGSGHHVASPLGAWLLLALCAPAAAGEAAARGPLGEVLGCDAKVAARLMTGRMLHDLPPAQLTAQKDLGTGTQLDDATLAACARLAGRCIYDGPEHCRHGRDARADSTRL